MAEENSPPAPAKTGRGGEGIIYWLQDSYSPLADEPILSQAERQRVEKLSHPRKQRQFLRGRLLLQFALQDLLGSPLAYTLDESGAVDCDQPGYALGLSHSREVTVVGIGPGSRLGLDIEAIRSRDYLAVAKAYFHPDECQRLKALPADEGLNRFYQLWCLKEARVKYLRSGIFSGHLSQDTLQEISSLQPPLYYAGRHHSHALALCYPVPQRFRLVEVHFRQGRLAADFASANLLPSPAI